MSEQAANVRPARLLVRGRAVAAYDAGTALPRTVSPRPYLHPVHTLAGTAVTDLMPADHRHHLGLSLAVADVDGTSFWGGRTFVRGSGPTWLDNHGRQRRTALAAGASAIEETLEWCGPGGDVLASERREIGGEPAGEGWALRWRSTIRVDRPTRIASPAVNGRPGAGYGGLFWRFPSWNGVRVVVAEGETERAAHGSTSRWLAVAGTDPGGRDATVILVQPAPGPPLPWFVRAGEYLGAGPALAWTTALELPAAAVLTCGLDALVLDGRIDDAGRAAALVDTLLPDVASGGR